MFRIILQALLIAVLVACGAYYFFGDRLQRLLVHEACSRQVRNVCRAIDKNVVTIDAVCHIPLPEIPELKGHYEAIKVRDGRWYQDHGWTYYPQVTCDGDQIKLDFMDKKFICNGSEVIPSRN